MELQDKSLDPEDHLLWKMTRPLVIILTSLPPLFTPGGLALSDSEKAKALEVILRAHFQPVSGPSEPAIIEVVKAAMRAYSFATASWSKLTNLTEVRDAIRV